MLYINAYSIVVHNLLHSENIKLRYIMAVEKIKQQIMKEDESGCKWMKVDKSEWNCVKVDERGWKG